MATKEIDPVQWKSGYDYGWECTRHEDRPQMRDVLKNLHRAASSSFERGMLAAYSDALGDTKKSTPPQAHATTRQPRGPLAYRRALKALDAQLQDLYRAGSYAGITDEQSRRVDARIDEVRKQIDQLDPALFKKAPKVSKRTS